MPYPFTLDDILNKKLTWEDYEETQKPKFDYGNLGEITPEGKKALQTIGDIASQTQLNPPSNFPRNQNKKVSKQSDIFQTMLDEEKNKNFELAKLNSVSALQTDLVDSKRKDDEYLSDRPLAGNVPLNSDTLDILFKGTNVNTKSTDNSKFGPKDLLLPNIEESKSEVKSTKPSVNKKVDDIMDTAVAKKIAESMGIKDTSLEDALARRDNLQGLALAAQGAQQLGAALAGTKAIEGYGQDLAKYGQQGVADIALKREHEMKQNELKRMRDLNDPNSKSSDVQRAMAKNLLKKIGHNDIASRITDDMSAQVVKDFVGNVNIQNLVQQYEANQTKLQLLEARKLAAADKALDKKTADNMKFITSAAEKLMKSKPYIAYDKAMSAREKVQAILSKGKDQTSADDIGVLYEYVKAMDPESAVREGETQLAKSGLSHLTNIKNAIAKFGKSPRILSPEFISNIKNYMDISQSVYKERLDKQINIYKHMSKQRGITNDEMYPLDMVGSPGTNIENDLGFEEGN